MRILFLVLIFMTGAISQEFDQPLAVLTALKGDVRIYHPDQGTEKRACLLDYLFSGDTLIINDKGCATLFFKNGLFHEVENPGRLAINHDLPANKTRDSLGMSVFFKDICALKLDYNELDTKYVTAPEETVKCNMYCPGNTALINARPDIIWSTCPGANWYTMRIRRASKILKSIATTDTAYAYPEHDDDMEPGGYDIQILAVHNSDTLYKITRSLFILDSLSIYNTGQTMKMIGRQKCDDFTITLLTAVFLRKKQLRSMAIESFKKLLADMPSSLILYKSMAELYYELGFVDLGNSFLGLSEQKIEKPDLPEN
jgi:hypothetical protein